MDVSFTTAAERLLRLLDDPVKLRVLGSGRLRELLFTIIEGEAGPLTRRTFGGSHDISLALACLRENIGSIWRPALLAYRRLMILHISAWNDPRPVI